MAGDFSRGQKQIVPNLFPSGEDIWLSRPTCVRGTPELQVQNSTSVKRSRPALEKRLLDEVFIGRSAPVGFSTCPIVSPKNAIAL